jgi:hypothetical protein
VTFQFVWISFQSKETIERISSFQKCRKQTIQLSTIGKMTRKYSIMPFDSMIGWIFAYEFNKYSSKRKPFSPLHHTSCFASLYQTSYNIIVSYCFSESVSNPQFEGCLYARYSSTFFFPIMESSVASLKLRFGTKLSFRSLFGVSWSWFSCQLTFFPFYSRISVILRAFSELSSSSWSISPVKITLWVNLFLSHRSLLLCSHWIAPMNERTSPTSKSMRRIMR